MSHEAHNLPLHVRQAMYAKAMSKMRPARGMRPVARPNNIDLDRGYWHDPGVEPENVIDAGRGGWRKFSDHLPLDPLSELAPDSVDPQYHAHVTVVEPPWNEPPFWSVPFEERLISECIPTYEDWYTVGVINMPDMHMGVIRDFSFDVTSGLVQYELFEFSIRASGVEIARLEDMIIDPMTADPNHRYVFASDVQPHRILHQVDRSRNLIVMVRVRGLVDLAGNSNRLPGDPLVPAANFRVIIRGYYAPFRHNLDGAPRHQDLGNMGFYDMEQVGSDLDRVGF